LIYLMPPYLISAAELTKLTQAVSAALDVAAHFHHD